MAEQTQTDLIDRLPPAEQAVIKKVPDQAIRVTGISVVTKPELDRRPGDRVVEIATIDGLVTKPVNVGQGTAAASADALKEGVRQLQATAQRYRTPKNFGNVLGGKPGK